MSEDTVKTEAEGATSPEGRRLTDFELHHYLLFGGESGFAFDSLSVVSARDYLQKGFGGGPLTHERTERGISLKYKGYSAPGAHMCDFCGRRMTGVEYQVMRDGRERCRACSETVVRGQEALTKLFVETKDRMCEEFAIDFPVPISVRVTTAERIAHNRHKSFVPTPGFDPRAVGYATNSKGAYTIVLENETPRMSLVSTISHELTHIWQFTHWDLNEIRRLYGRYDLAILEGMAVWTEIQLLYLLNEARRADTDLALSVVRKDEYGFGLRLYLKQYPLSNGVVLEGKTPFENVRMPIDKSLIAG